MPASARLLRLLQIASPALPIGAFHFSQGLEFAVHAGWVRDEPSAADWIEGMAATSVATLDLPVAARLHCAWLSAHFEAARTWNAFLEAARETEELRGEERHMGTALAKALIECGLEDIAGQFPEQRCTYAAAFTCACVRWDIPVEQTLATYAWVWSEQQVLAAMKLVPLGQRAGLRVLTRVLGRIPGWVAAALKIADNNIGIGTVRLGLASALHESQYTRLFRS